ncbi:hypothetical protein DPMN_095609 [Dreissena polymorpha]|uniref:Uncharacterized protein n=1 Tax=Dreissena polymorpha TaxID=45954 RepID=A0A9D4L7R1_DREPO|nr:hypothetical protein DPMN_095609 [Dreissena polymorpha]
MLAVSRCQTNGSRHTSVFGHLGKTLTETGFCRQSVDVRPYGGRHTSVFARGCRSLSFGSASIDPVTGHHRGPVIGHKKKSFIIIGLFFFFVEGLIIVNELPP